MRNAEIPVGMIAIEYCEIVGGMFTHRAFIFTIEEAKIAIFGAWWICRKFENCMY